MAGNNYQHYISELRKALPIGRSFDVVERKFEIGGRQAEVFFIDGLVKGQLMHMLLSDLLCVSKSTIDAVEASKESTEEFMRVGVPLLDCSAQDDIPAAIKQLYSGLVLLAIDGLDKLVVLDVRDYPSRGVSEPEKEKTLRGAKDGFTESYKSNIALVRRRIRDTHLICENFIVGEVSKTDVCLIYMDGIADDSLVQKMREKLSSVNTDTLTVAEQSLIELLEKDRKGLRSINPLPRVRYTQRPDVVAAHVTEGKLAIAVDNSPTVILFPAGIFDFLQDVDDYYFPKMTGNYFRGIRMLNAIAIIFLTPVYLLITEGYIPIHESISFFIPAGNFAIPIFWQFILLEVAIDGLKLASLNTPESLGMSLSVIGALILGEFSVESGWFIPQTILCMAVVALASFTQPSIELGYAVKFLRIMILVGVAVGGFWGALAALLVGLIVTATTRTISNTSYLYPLLPFNGRALKRLLLRTRK